MKEILNKITKELKDEFEGTVIHTDIDEEVSLVEFNIYTPTKDKTFASRKLLIKYPFKEKDLKNYLHKTIISLQNDDTLSYLQGILNGKEK